MGMVTASGITSDSGRGWGKAGGLLWLIVGSVRMGQGNVIGRGIILIFVVSRQIGRDGLPCQSLSYSTFL